jgi:hypothetical protein
MLSKQKTKKLFSNQYIESVDNTKEDLGKNHIMTSSVKITSIRIKDDKYFVIKLPSYNPLKKPSIRMHINKTTRPNYENGSIDMYRFVNGLCHYCGHNEYQGTIDMSKEGYTLGKMFCAKCGRKQPMMYVTDYKKKDGIDRGKDFAERKKILNETKSDHKKQLKKG